MKNAALSTKEILLNEPTLALLDTGFGEREGLKGVLKPLVRGSFLLPPVPLGVWTTPFLSSGAVKLGSAMFLLLAGDLAGDVVGVVGENTSSDSRSGTDIEIGPLSFRPGCKYPLWCLKSKVEPLSSSWVCRGVLITPASEVTSSEPPDRFLCKSRECLFGEVWYSVESFRFCW